MASPRETFGVSTENNTEQSCAFAIKAARVGRSEFAELMMSLMHPFQSGGRARKCILLSFFALVLIAQGAFEFFRTDAGRPYENADELGTYNTARTPPAPGADLVFSYGSIGQFLQWAAMKYYDNFDPVGKTHHFIAYSNNVDESLEDPSIAGSARTWPWTGVDYFDFRGLADRTPVFLSRKLHLAVTWLIAFAIGCLAIGLYDLRAVTLIVPLLALMSGPEFSFQATQSLPNAPAAMLAFACALCALIYLDREKVVYLILSTAAGAVATNFKIDAVLLGSAPALAILLEWLRRGWRPAFYAAAAAAVTAVAVALATRPSLLPNPLADLRHQLAMMNYNMGPTINADILSWPNIDSRVRVFARFLAPNAILGGVGAPAALLIVCVLFIAFFVFVWRTTGQQRFTVAAGAVVALGVWAYAVLLYPFLDGRYFLNGLAVCYATLGMFLLYYLDSDKRLLRNVSVLLFAAVCVQYIANFSLNADDSWNTLRANGNSMGLDPRHSRNIASLSALKMMQEHGPNAVLLIDQHAYFDLRLFWLHHIEPRYINMFNADQVLGALDPAKTYIVLFSQGTTDPQGLFHPAWVGHWPPKQQMLYAHFQQLLDRLPVAQHFGDHLQKLLDPGPVNPTDEISIAVIGPSAT